MSTDLQTNRGSESPTTINALLRDLTELLLVKDARLAYLASAAVERLTRLRADAAAHSIVHWDLRQKTFLTEPYLAKPRSAVVAILDEIVDTFHSRIQWWYLDLSAREALSRIEEAWKLLKEG